MFVDITPCRLSYYRNAEFVGQNTTVAIHMDRKESFTNGRSVLSFNVLYNGDNCPFITVPTITGPVDFVLDNPLPTREEFNKTPRGKSLLAAERIAAEKREHDDVWRLMSNSVSKVSKKLLTARPKQTRRFSSGLPTFSVDEIFEFFVEEIGPQHSIAAIMSISTDEKECLYNWLRKTAHRLTQETYQKSAKIS